MAILVFAAPVTGTGRATAIISGGADLILDKADGQSNSLAIIDYKTSADPEFDEDYGLQFAVYADAGCREGLDVRAAYVPSTRSRSLTTARVQSTAAGREPVQ